MGYHERGFYEQDLVLCPTGKGNNKCRDTFQHHTLLLVTHVNTTQ